MILIIDNYDSFTYNLVQYFGATGRSIRVLRNDASELLDLQPGEFTHVVISPGPGQPSDAGHTNAVIKRFAGRVPILGVCLGHQAIGEVFGGRVVRAPAPVHGKAAVLHHDGKGIFRGLAQDIRAARYHSLVVEQCSIPKCLQVSATSGDGLVMALRHRELPIEGVQFHPESILTDYGHEMIGNFLHA